MKNWRALSLKVFAVLTVVLDGANMAHWMPIEWLIFVSALITAVLVFLQEYELELQPQEPPKPTPAPPTPTPVKKG